MKPTAALFIHDPKCSVQSGNGILHALRDDFQFKIFSKHEVEDVFFDDVDIVMVPGGFGDSDSYDILWKKNARAVRRFVRQGGRYLGICMGAYWAGSHYLNILDSVDAVQYIRRPGSDTHRPHAKAMPIDWQGQSCKMFWYDGCALVGDHRRFQTVATYANGDSMAIYQNRIGLIGCHPEAEKFWYDEYSWMPRHWTGGQHHLLQGFVADLMAR